RDWSSDVCSSDLAGGACVLSDCVPSKALIASSDAVTAFRHGERLGVRVSDPASVSLDASVVHARVKRLALAQSADIAGKRDAAGVELVRGRARLGSDAPGHHHPVIIEPAVGAPYEVEATHVLIATGATPRVLPACEPDGERILSWRQVYDLTELPAHLVVIGSGVTGAEFASAYLAAGVEVTLVSSRDRVMPHEDPDAAGVIERVFRGRGMTVLGKSRASSVSRTADGVLVTLD